MNSEGFILQGSITDHRDRNKESFLRDVPKYSGTAEDYSRAHARAYGGEEHLAPDGSHPPGRSHFPDGTDRDTRHNEYTLSTHPRDTARISYRKAHQATKAELKGMNPSEREYYVAHTCGLRPDQHARLHALAHKLASTSYSNATGRENFLRAHPYGYHDLTMYTKHYKWASDAYGEYEDARGQQALHEKHRSYNGDSRRDRYNRPMSRGDY